MPRPIIEVENLCKCYRLGQFNAQTMREEVEQFFARFRNKKAGRGGDRSGGSSEFWALKDVSFSVQPGEVVGIIGRNGAGKSTLLKILSRVTEPTAGQARIRGRIASLLEVGTGFHSELTGRENIYLNGAILGMTRAEIRSKFDEIVAFAEVDRFLDTPVKRYSSGMCVRLAFAVAAHLEPEILLVDEVLAVGDVEFQRKCLGKMKSVSADRGRTVLFVSHNMTAISSLCHRAILLKSGSVNEIGNAEHVVKSYLTPIRAGGKTRRRHWPKFADAPGDKRVRVRSVELIAVGSPDADIERDTPFNVIVDYWNLVEGANLIVEVIVNALDGTVVFHSLSSEDKSIGNTPLQRGLFRSICSIPGGLLNEGNYTIDVHFMHGAMSMFTSVVEALTLTITDSASRGDFIYLGRFLGNVHPILQWNTKLLEPISNQ